MAAGRKGGTFAERARERKRMMFSGDGASSWGLFWEGPLRSAVKKRVGNFLGVPGSQFPIRDFLKARFKQS